MQTAKLFKNGSSQAVRLPKEFQFNGKDVLIHKYGDAVLLTPHDRKWEVFLESISEFSDDYLADGRDMDTD